MRTGMTTDKIYRIGKTAFFNPLIAALIGLSFWSFAWSPAAWAWADQEEQPAEISLVKVTSEADSIINHFKVVVGADNEIQSLIIDDEITPPSNYSLANVKEGFSTLENGACRLRSPDLRPDEGGTIILRILRRFPGDFRELALTLREENGQWGLYSNEKSGRRKIDRLHFTVRKFMGKPIGVRTVEFYARGEHFDTVDLGDL